MDSADYQKKKSAKTLLMQNAASNTPKTQVGQTSIDIIPQPDDAVNPSDENVYSDRDSDYLDAVNRGDMLLPVMLIAFIWTNFVAPQFIQEITKNVQHKLNVFCRFRPKVEIISWSFKNTV